MYVDGSLAHVERDLGTSSISAQMQDGECFVMDHPDRSIGCIMALSVRYRDESVDGWYCPRKMAHDALTSDELYMVVGYMSSPMHLGIPSKEDVPPKAW